MLDAPVRSGEFLNALKGLNKNKSPGMDGLTTEFYVKFWDSLRCPFMRMAVESFTRKKMSRTTSMAVISLMPKTLEVETVNDFRLLSLTNTDYKTIAKTLSYRLYRVIA